MTRFPVPCGGCTACCRTGGFIFLYPDKGDNEDIYQTERAIDPIAGRETRRLKQKPDSSCIYLGDKGCTIINSAPHVCRVFDCRTYFRSLPPKERKRRMKAGDEMLHAAKERM